MPNRQLIPGKTPRPTTHRRARGADRGHGSHDLFDLVACASAIVASVALSYVVSPLSALRPWTVEEGYRPFWNLLGRYSSERAPQGEEVPVVRRVVDARDRSSTSQGPASAGFQAAPSESSSSGAAVAGEHPVPGYLESPGALEHFFASLAKTELRAQARITRVSHWGDSMIGNDGITAAVRRKMQARFGDAGHGFHAVSQYNASYRHQGVAFHEQGKWQRCNVIHRRVECAPGRRFGYGGSLASARRNAGSVFGTVDRGPNGRSLAHFELWYQAHPHGGVLEVEVDGTRTPSIDTHAPGLEDRLWRIDLPDGPHRVRVRAAGGGQSRVYGVVLEGRSPGVVWDSMALIGSFTDRMNFQDPAHLKAQIAERGPDLIVTSFGGNDLSRELGPLKHTMAPYEAELTTLLRRLRAGAPRASCLVMAPVDHGERRGLRIVSRPVVARLVDAQRRVALAEGCAFFDTYAAMGGEGSVGRWYRQKPRLMSPDLSHASAKGQQVIGGELLFEALMAAYRAATESKVRMSSGR